MGRREGGPPIASRCDDSKKEEGVFCLLNDLLILSGFCVCFAFYFSFIAHCTIVVFSTHFLQGIRDFPSPFFLQKTTKGRTIFDSNFPFLFHFSPSRWVLRVVLSFFYPPLPTFVSSFLGHAITGRGKKNPSSRNQNLGLLITRTVLQPWVISRTL